MGRDFWLLEFTLQTYLSERFSKIIWENTESKEFPGERKKTEGSLIAREFQTTFPWCFYLARLQTRLQIARWITKTTERMWYKRKQKQHSVYAHKTRQKKFNLVKSVRMRTDKSQDGTRWSIERQMQTDRRAQFIDHTRWVKAVWLSTKATSQTFWHQFLIIYQSEQKTLKLQTNSKLWSRFNYQDPIQCSFFP